MSENRNTGSFAPVGDDERRVITEERPMLAGVPVREDDIESVKGLRFIAYLFRGMATLLLLLMVLQVMSGLSGAVVASPGVVFAEAVRLVIFAGLLWGAGDLAVLWVKSHYDIRASRILLARLEYMMRQQGEADGRSFPTGELPRGDGDT
jgi:hypothetical protein